jgi:hypothetical protein
MIHQSVCDVKTQVSVTLQSHNTVDLTLPKIKSFNTFADTPPCQDFTCWDSHCSTKKPGSELTTVEVDMEKRERERERASEKHLCVLTLSTSKKLRFEDSL